MLYGAAGHTGALIARHAHQRGHRPLLAGRSAPATAALAGELDLPYLALALDDPAALNAALADVDLVLNAAGPFLHTAAPLAEACLTAGAHYIDIGNELQVFLALYELHQRAQRRGVTIIPGAGFGVVATNCLTSATPSAAPSTSKSRPGPPPPGQAPASRPPYERTSPTEAGPAGKATCTPARSAREPSRSPFPAGTAASCPSPPGT